MTRQRRRKDLLFGLAVAVVLAVVLWIVVTLRSQADDLVTANQARDALARQVQELGGRPVAGPPGSRGEPGESVIGPQGAPGEPGPPGQTGADGRAGVEGEQGTPGAAGASGEPGPSGDAGIAGVPGPAGPQGEPGPAGPAGPAGPRGPAGMDGQTCPTGYSLQPPADDPDALVCRRDGAPPADDAPAPSTPALLPDRRRN